MSSVSIAADLDTLLGFIVAFQILFTVTLAYKFPSSLPTLSPEYHTKHAPIPVSAVIGDAAPSAPRVVEAV